MSYRIVELCTRTQLMHGINCLQLEARSWVPSKLSHSILWLPQRPDSYSQLKLHEAS